jgi:hypothetical protein
MVGVVLGLSLVLTSGCGGGVSRAKVTGQVTYQGAPLPGGSITFHGQDKFVRSAYIDPGGRYLIVGAPAGEIKVAVTAPPPAAAAAPAAAAPAAGKSSGKHASKTGSTPAAPVVAGVALPPKFNDPEQSGLTYTLTGGDQTLDIELK